MKPTICILKFSYKFDAGLLTGRELLASLNSSVLEEIIGEQMITLNASSPRQKSLKMRMLAILGWLDGLEYKHALECIARIKENKIQVVYIEGSNYGRLAKIIKDQIPSCKIVSFFHNVESIFFWGAFRSKPSFHALSVLLANFVAERWSVKNSDRLICLNKRDSDALLRIYGRRATDIVPMSIMESSTCKVVVDRKSELDRFGIFVGGAFYANLSGMQWFARHVAPHLPCDIYIVGKDFEQHESYFESFSNIKVVGSVADVSDWYHRASFAIAPIFAGSGMKTKVAEALMHGIPVVGTPEAFVGYEDVIDDAGIVCNSGMDFINAISAVYSGQVKFEHEVLRGLFDQFYSFAAAKNNFRRVIYPLLM